MTAQAAIREIENLRPGAIPVATVTWLGYTYCRACRDTYVSEGECGESHIIAAEDADARDRCDGCGSGCLESTAARVARLGDEAGWITDLGVSLHAASEAMLSFPKSKNRSNK